MATKFFVPKFITLEDRIAGILTFRQLFALFGAFLISYLFFKINLLLGFILGFFFFGLAFLFTFVYVNGKPFMNILPNVLEFYLRGRVYLWKKIEHISYKKIEIEEIENKEIKLPEIKKRETKIIGDNLILEIKYPEISKDFNEKVSISLQKPIAEQIGDISKIVHRHLVNTNNPYRFFPYVKFFRSVKI